MEAKLAKMVVKLICVWAFAWTPYAIMALWSMFFNAQNLSPAMGLIPLLFCKISAGLNVIVYGLRYCLAFQTFKYILNYNLVSIPEIPFLEKNELVQPFNRLPKFKTEVKKVLRAPLPALIIEHFPALQESISRQSSVYKEKRYSNRLRSSDPEFSTDSDQKTLKRIKSEPSPTRLKASIKDHRRTKSTKNKSSVKFSS